MEACDAFESDDVVHVIEASNTYSSGCITRVVQPLLMSKFICLLGLTEELMFESGSYRG